MPLPRPAMNGFPPADGSPPAGPQPGPGSAAAPAWKQPDAAPQAPRAPQPNAVHDLEALFREYGGRIYGLALRCGLSPRDAEDGVQEVFLKVQRKIQSFRGESKLSTWVYQVALNTLRDHRRRVTRQTRAANLSQVSEESADPAVESSQPGPMEEASRAERQQMVREALDALPAKFREVLVLRELEGMSYRDIARVLELRQGTVESRIFRARERLAADLRQRGGLS